MWPVCELFYYFGKIFINSRLSFVICDMIIRSKSYLGGIFYVEEIKK